MQNLLKYQKLTLWWALFVLVMCNIKMGKAGHSPLFFAGFDKLVHCGFFFMFTALAGYGIIKQRGNLTLAAAVKVFIIAVAYGAAIEVIQKYFFPWRGAEWGDLFADTVGAGMATFSGLITVTAIRDEKN
ncbi:VanZ family protein [Mucilaginibacter sp. PAMB04274]|uniref:VanZ family protein n=1 Tax=Mucilaginibacter sp. PAMB04274 TaxID=3138568 RepID=UPI0031F626D3